MHSTDGEKVKHIAFRVEMSMQLWAEKNIGENGYTVYQSMDIPGATPVQVAQAKTPLDADILISALTKTMARNIIEGSEVDVSALASKK